MKFRFSLEKVLEYRIQVEEQRAQDLALAQRRLQDLRTSLEDLRTRRSQLNGVSAGEGTFQTIGWQAIRDVSAAALDVEIERILGMIRGAETLVAQANDRYLQAFADRKTMDQIREQHFERWKKEERKRDQKITDEIARDRSRKSAE
jgi:flagellar protein FliJ